MDEKVVVRKFRITTQHGAIAGKTQVSEVNGYNLDLIISVGYRVKSPQGTKFRKQVTLGNQPANSSRIGLSKGGCITSTYGYTVIG